jgi:hypothetical protein
MSWTNDRPTTPGWYWFRRTAGDEPRVLRLDGAPDHLAHVYEIGIGGAPVTAALPSGEWCGPLAAPAA